MAVADEVKGDTSAFQILQPLGESLAGDSPFTLGVGARPDEGL
jgi:hypothetical protein